MTMNIRPFSMITSIFNTKLSRGELHEMETIDGSSHWTADGWGSGSALAATGYFSIGVWKLG